MPRIPQGEFDTNPSTRVGAPNSSLGPDNLAIVGKAVTNFTGAMAQLQDQSERAEAYQRANEVKQNYLKKKAVYDSAIETVNGRGEVSYFDPMDSNPDVSKRKRITRPAQEMYAEMVGEYEEQKKELAKLPRSDIASDLARQYVGDDLIQTQMKTNKLINRKREKETSEAVTENMELNLSVFREAASDPNATEESIGLALSHMNNKIARDVGAAAAILGTENTAQIQKLADRAYSSVAAQIISSGVTNSTVKAADGLVARIKDHGQRSLAISRLENIKKTTAEVKSVTILSHAQGLDQRVASSATLSDQDYVGVVNTVKQTMGIYTDPKYNTVVNDELKNKQATSLLSSALASRQSLDMLDMDMTFLANPSQLDPSDPNFRAPSGTSTGEGPKMRMLKDQIKKEIESSGLDGVVGKNPLMVDDIVNQTVQKMTLRRSSMKENLADMVRAKYPDAQGLEFINRINQASNANALGEVSYVGKKEISAFKEQFSTLMAKDSGQALSFFEQTLAAAGPAHEGKNSYRRALAMDYAGKDPSLAYLIPMADADDATKFNMVKEAALFKKVIDETDATAATFNESFESVKHNIPALNSLMKNHPSMYDGLKQAIVHKAAAKLANKQGAGKNDVPNLMKEAISEMGSMYTSVASPDGRSSVLALNRSQNYNSTENFNAIARGLKKAATQKFSRAEKIRIIQERYPQGEVSEHTPDYNLDFILERQVKIEPDARFPNVHVLKFGDGLLTNANSEVHSIEINELLAIGKADLEKEKKNRNTNIWNMR